MTQSAVSTPLPPLVSGRLPFFGNALDLLRDPLAFSQRVARRHGPLARVKAGPVSFLLLQGADGARQILWEKGDNYPKPALGMSTLEPLLGKSVATLVDDAEWRDARRFVLPLFTPKMLHAYFDEAVTSIRGEVERLDAYAKSGESIDMYHFMHAATFRVLIRTIFNRGIGPDEASELIDLFDAATSYINTRYITFGLPITWAIPAARKGREALKRLDERVYRLISERRAEGPTEAGDMLDALIQAVMADGTSLTDKGIRDNCMTMLFGGHETTAGSLTWTWGLLSANPEKRKRLLEEVDLTLGGADPAGFDVLQRLDYVDHAFTESMRLYPMFAFLMRQATQADVVEGFSVEAGETLAFSAYTIQRMEEFWPEPNEFIPERHTSDAKKGQHKAGFLAFSQGKRGCIGERMARMEAILMLSMISQKYELDLIDPLPEPSVRMSIKPVGGMKMKVRRR